MSNQLNLRFKDSQRFGLKLWPNKKLTFKQKNRLTKVQRFVQKRKNQKLSFFNRQLIEKQKISLFYGNLRHRSMSQIQTKLRTFQNHKLTNYFQLMEKRLDILLYRAKFAPTIGSARQLIFHGKILVNSQKITYPNFRAQTGDLISVCQTNLEKLTLSIKQYLIRVSTVYNLINKDSSPNLLDLILKKDPLLCGINLFKNLEKIKDSNSKYVEPKSSKITSIEYEEPGSSKIISIDTLGSPKQEVKLSSQIFSIINKVRKQEVLNYKYFFPKNLEKTKRTNQNIENEEKLLAKNKYKLPHLEINYKTLTIVVLPYQSNFGLQPKFPEKLNYGNISRI